MSEISQFWKDLHEDFKDGEFRAAYIEAFTEVKNMERVMDAFWDTDGLFDQVSREARRAVDKHTFDRTPASLTISDASKLVILVEEVGEMARALTYDEGDREELKKELIQTATMALMWAASL